MNARLILTQSGQPNLEAAALALGKVYCFGPTFRAEKSKTRRHLTEFWMLETEIAFAELEDILGLAEALLCFIMARVLTNRPSELATLERPTAPLEAIRAPLPPPALHRGCGTSHGRRAIRLTGETTWGRRRRLFCPNPLTDR